MAFLLEGWVPASSVAPGLVSCQSPLGFPTVQLKSVPPFLTR